MSELDPALTLEALFIPNQSPRNPKLVLGLFTLSPSSNQISERLHSRGQGFCSAPGIWKLGGLQWSQVLEALLRRAGGMGRGAFNMSISPHSAVPSWLGCTKRGPLAKVMHRGPGCRRGTAR